MKTVQPDCRAQSWRSRARVGIWNERDAIVEPVAVEVPFPLRNIGMTGSLIYQLQKLGLNRGVTG